MSNPSNLFRDIKCMKPFEDPNPKFGQTAFRKLVEEGVETVEEVVFDKGGQQRAENGAITYNPEGWIPLADLKDRKKGRDRFWRKSPAARREYEDRHHRAFALLRMRSWLGAHA